MASNQALKLQIARVKNTVLNGAMLQFANRPMANKTEAMEVLAEMVINGSIIDGLGVYPHAALDMSSRKTQGTRMLKASCPSCSYTVRLTAKWAFDSYGNPRLPVCPCGDTLALV